MIYLFLSILLVILSPLAAQVSSEASIKCGFAYRKTRKISLPSRPALPIHLDTQHFRIWYDTTGYNATTPEYANKVAQSAEYSYQIEVDLLGYPPPLPDSSICEGRTNVGGDDRTDIYILELGGRYFGESLPEDPCDTIPWQCPGFMKIDNDYLEPNYGYQDNPIEALKVTVAHEFFHLIQFGIDSEEDIWWMEATAVYMEDIVYDEVNDYISYLPDFFDYPEIPLNSTSGAEQHIYGAVVFPKFLQKYIGDEIIKDIWMECGEYGVNSVDAISRVTELESTFQEFALWNLFTGSRADTVNYYSEGQLWPQVAEEKIDSLGPLDIILGSPLATKYCTFDSIGRNIWQSSGRMNYHFTPQSGVWSFKATAFPSYGVSWSPFISDGNYQGSIDELYEFSQIIFVCPLLSGSNGQASLVAEVEGEPVTARDTIYHPYPNPSLNAEVNFPFFLAQEGDVSMVIWDITGKLIASETLEDLAAGPHTYDAVLPRWGIPNATSSVYIYLLKTPTVQKKGRLAVIR